LNPLDGLQDGISELLEELGSQNIFGPDSFYFSQYCFWMGIAIIILLIVVFAAKKREALVPHGRFLNGVEAVVQWVRDDICRGIIDNAADRHLPFLLTLFFLIVINNLLGLVPGAKPGTGTFSNTFTLSLIVFIYFNYYGIKHQGLGRYIKNIAPSGIGVLYPLVWLIELVSLFLRLLTLAIRLFANMYAGHIVMGVFSILASLFFSAAIQGAGALIALPSVAWILLLVCMYAIELLVAVIQAYVFTLLSAVYISLATSNSH
jgi:F-type H+-transporting ATPase subunit a